MTPGDSLFTLAVGELRDGSLITMICVTLYVWHICIFLLNYYYFFVSDSITCIYFIVSYLVCSLEVSRVYI